MRREHRLERMKVPVPSEVVADVLIQAIAHPECRLLATILLLVVTPGLGVFGLMCC